MTQVPASPPFSASPRLNSRPSELEDAPRRPHPGRLGRPYDRSHRRPRPPAEPQKTDPPLASRGNRPEVKYAWGCELR